MTLSPLLLSLSLVATQGLGAADVAAPAEVLPPADCSVEGPLTDPTRVIDRREAPVGGRWWLPRLVGDPNETELLSPERLRLRRGDGVALDALDVVTTPAALAIAVPEEASPGDVFGLFVDGAPLPNGALRVSTSPAVEPPFELVELTLLDPVASDCRATCNDPTFLVPGVPVVALTYQGGPAVLDIWGVLAEEVTPTDEIAREVDSYALPAADAPNTVELTIGEASSSFAPIDLHVRVRDPDTLAELHRETRALGQTNQVPMPIDESLPDCGGQSTPSGCPFSSTTVVALAPALLLLRLRRRRA